MQTYTDKGDHLEAVVDGATVSIPKDRGNADYRAALAAVEQNTAVILPEGAVPLGALQDAVIERIKSATNSVFLGLYPQLKQWAIARSVPPYDGPERVQMDAAIQELCAIQADAAEDVRSCGSPEALATLVEDLTAMYGGDL